MVLGLRTRTLKSIPLQIDYLINVLEIHPWTSSDARKSAHSVLLQCENGGESCGIFVSSVGDGKIDFTKAFRLTVSLLQEVSKKSASRDAFQNNFLEFHLYEVRKEKKGKLLGSASINLADYATITDNVVLNIPVYLKKTSKHSAQPILYVSIQTLDKDSSAASPENSLSKDISAAGSASEMIDGGNNDEAEIASFTDDDDDDDGSSSLHSSRTVSNLETTMASPTDRHRRVVELGIDTSDRNQLAETVRHMNGSSSRTVALSDILSGTELLGRGPNFSSQQTLESERVADGSTRIQQTMTKGDDGGITDSLIGKASEDEVRSVLNANFSDSTTNQEVDRRQIKAVEEKYTSSALNLASFGNKEKKEQQECAEREADLEKTKNHINNQIDRKIQVDAVRKIEKSGDILASGRNTLGMHGGSLRNDKLKHLKSLQLNFDSSKSGGIYAIDMISNHKNKDVENAPKISVPSDSDKTSRDQAKDDDKGNDLSETKISSMATDNDGKSNYTSKLSDSKIELEREVEMLREELTEAAAVEISLYSVVAEHGSSAYKVHAPARRLHRFYCHIRRSKSSSSLAYAARTIVSGLMLVTKSCGHDVPRLTFWLSNAILLRRMIKEAVEKLQISPAQRKNSNAEETLENWDEPLTLISAMEKVEAWIFNRIVESVWWQSLTPYMQSAASKGSSSRKTSAKRYVIGDQDQGKFSIDLWKKAFTEAGERLCPLRAGGHECGCLHIITKLVIEQLVGRLDVAMFNAILRESADEMPTDPFSDPISDSKVLPVPAGKTSFGSGAQLKNAVGNWSRCLTDLYGIDDSDSLGDRNELNDNHEVAPFKVFKLLDALSDLMMLPFEMLAEQSTRREVCPNLGVPLIRRVITNFVPDEFCPSPVPEALINALESEDCIEDDKKSAASYPCVASPTMYSPPSVSSLREVGSVPWSSSGSPMLRKSYTSDDELDELDSPLNALIIGKTRSSPNSSGSNLLPKDKGGRRVVRYDLLREIWGDNH